MKVDLSMWVFFLNSQFMILLRLKRDMMTKLESVAAEFRAASHGQMAATTQRTIRENVSISAQNAQLSEQLSEVTAENKRLSKANADLARKIEILEDEQRRLIRGNVYK